MPEPPPITERDTEGLVGPLTSLVLGAALFGRDALSNTLRELEHRTTDPAPPPPVNGSTLDHAVVGLLFESERFVTRSVRRAAHVGAQGLQMTRSAAEATGAARVGAWAWSVLQPVSSPVERRLARLVEVGKEQEARARSLADTAFRGVTEVSIREATVRVVEEVAHSDKAREVLRAETLSAAEAAVGEVREIAKEADSRLENLARSIFRRAPRRLISPADGAVP